MMRSIGEDVSLSSLLRWVKKLEAKLTPISVHKQVIFGLYVSFLLPFSIYGCNLHSYHQSEMFRARSATIRLDLRFWNLA